MLKSATRWGWTDQDVRILLCTAATDMRKSFDSLAALVQQVMGEDPLSGRLFVFHNRRADRLKLLYWDGDGYAIWYKRLEAGQFRFPRADANRTGVTISAAELAWLLEGVDLGSLRRSARYRRPVPLPGARP